jgi:hypothetical protein
LGIESIDTIILKTDKRKIIFYFYNFLRTHSDIFLI